MTIKQYAKEQAQKLIDNPTRQTAINVVNNIISLRVNDEPITDSQIELILDLLESEIGTLTIVNESFANTETLTLIGQVRELIAQAKNNE